MFDWGFIHPECAPEPGRYSHVPVEAFYGRFVQLKFVGSRGNDRMWVEVTGPAETPGQELQGIVSNEPIKAIEWSEGTIIEFLREEIIKVDIIDLPPTPFQSNPDEEFRRAERRGAAGDIEQQAKALTLKVRRGDLERWRVSTASQLGHLPSTLITAKDPRTPKSIKYWWTKLTFLIPDSHIPLRFEIRFRAVIAALRAVLPYWDDPPGTLFPYTEEVLTFLEYAFLEDEYGIEGEYSEDFGVESGVIREVYVGHANAGESSNFTRRFSRAMIQFLTAYHVYAHQGDDLTILPHAHPNGLLERALQELDVIFPVGVGSNIQKEASKELIPWILLDYDPILMRSTPPGWTGNEVRANI